MNSHEIFNEKDIENYLKYYIDNGFVHIRPTDDSVQDLIAELYKYYSRADGLNFEKAFSNTNGYARHFINIFRDEHNADAKKLYMSEFYRDLINSLMSSERMIYTHSKLSFKTPGENSNWLPHQDNGYKLSNDLRSGFAIFTCLEDMSIENGALQIWPKSHKVGFIDHKRIVENQNKIDNQLFIENVPQGLLPITVDAKQGDILIFHANAIHTSGSSKTTKRYAIIAEVEAYERMRLDDYGMTPILIKGELTFFERLHIYTKMSMSKSRYWRLLKNNFPQIAKLIRRFKYGYF